MYSNPALKIIGLFVVVHPINWDTSHTIQYIRIHHRQSNILGYIRGNPLFADNPIHWNALENDPILCHTLVVHPINWVMYISNSFRFKGTYHRQSNKLGFITDNPIYWDMLETLQYIGKYCRQGYILTE